LLEPFKNIINNGNYKYNIEITEIMSMTVRMLKIKKLITGWVNYFCIADMKGLVNSLDEWLRRRIRILRL
jgi:hypothetical protein